MSVLCEIKDKICDLVDGDDLATAKLCLIEDGINGPCPTKIEGVNAETNTVLVEGDKTLNFSAGQMVNLLDVNSASIGTGTVGTAVYSAETNQTSISMSEVSLNEGKTLTQAVAVKPVSALTVKAVETVATLTKTATAREVVKRTATVAERVQ